MKLKLLREAIQTNNYRCIYGIYNRLQGASRKNVLTI